MTRAFAAVVLTALLAAGCASVVDGSGTNSHSAGPGSRTRLKPTPSGSVPTPSGSVPTSGSSFPSSGPASGSPSGGTPTRAANFTCPGIVYPVAKITFTCFSPNLTSSLKDPVWPLVEYVAVDSSGWTAETGAGHWGTLDTDTLSAITDDVRTRMVGGNAYGTKPSLSTTLNHDTVLDGRPAHELATTITLNPAFAKAKKTKVRHEKLWIVAIETSFNDVSLWFISLPDLTRDRWPQVEGYIRSIRVL